MESQIASEAHINDPATLERRLKGMIAGEGVDPTMTVEERQELAKELEGVDKVPKPSSAGSSSKRFTPRGEGKSGNKQIDWATVGFAALEQGHSEAGESSKMREEFETILHEEEEDDAGMATDMPALESGGEVAESYVGDPEDAPAYATHQDIDDLAAVLETLLDERLNGVRSELRAEMKQLKADVTSIHQQLSAALTKFNGLMGRVNALETAPVKPVAPTKVAISGPLSPPLKVNPQPEHKRSASKPLEDLPVVAKFLEETPNAPKSAIVRKAKLGRLLKLAGVGSAPTDIDPKYWNMEGLTHYLSK